VAPVVSYNCALDMSPPPWLSPAHAVHRPGVDAQESRSRVHYSPHGRLSISSGYSPVTLAGRDAPGRLLFSAAVELFEEFGFTRGRQIGKHPWVVRRVVDRV
jgi:hypothetical protein